MNYSTIFFDLDDTLYDSGNGLWGAIKERMSLYMLEHLGMPRDEIEQLRSHYYQTYGTTLRGLQRHHQVDADEFLAFVHDLPLEKYLKPNPGLGKLLESLPQDKYIFTNADANHARRVLSILGISNNFKGIIDIRAMNFACKPERLAFEHALSIAGNPLAKECVFIDDAIANLAGSRQLGFTTVWISRNGQKDLVANHTISEITQLPEVMPELWR